MSSQLGPDPELKRSAELVDISQLPEVASWLVMAMFSGLVGNAAYDLVRRFLTKNGGRKTLDLQEQVIAELVARFPQIPAAEVRARVVAMMERGNFTAPEHSGKGAPSLDSGYIWELFLIHPSSEAALTKEIYDLVAKRVATFLDAANVDPGDVWPMSIASALRSSRVYAVLLPSNIDRHWYATEEVAQAIHYVRRDPRRRIVPIQLDPVESVDLPYGLSSVQGLSMHHRDPALIADGILKIVKCGTEWNL